MWELNGYFSHEITLTGFKHRNFLAPFLVGFSFIGMGLFDQGAYIRIYDEIVDSKLINFGLVCLILGSSCIILSICWFVFEYKDRKQIEDQNRIRQNVMNRVFFLDLNAPSAYDNRIYSTYLNNQRRNSSRWCDQEFVANQQPPPSYAQAISFSPNLIKCFNEYSNKKDEDNKSKSINAQNKLEVLSVSELQNGCPSYEEAIKMSKYCEENKSTRL